jgi:uncharacterized membrane protein
MRETRRINKRVVLNVLAFLVIVIIFALIPTLPKYSQGSFFYPAIFFYDSPLFYFVTFGLFAFLVWNLIKVTPKSEAIDIPKPVFIGGLVTICGCMTFCGLNLYFAIAQVFPAHFDSIRFQNHVYYLAYYTASDSGLDVVYNDYLVYECDDLGVVCHRIDRFFGWDLPYVPPHDRRVNFFHQDNQLYVRINDEQFPVRTSSEE